MRHVAITLAVLAVCLTASAQTPQPQLTQVPPKPTCHLLFKTGPCADMWAAYNQAVQQRTREELQLYVSRQKDIASAQATAPLQQQIGPRAVGSTGAKGDLAGVGKPTHV